MQRQRRRFALYPYTRKPRNALLKNIDQPRRQANAYPDAAALLQPKLRAMRTGRRNVDRKQQSAYLG